MAIGKEPTGAYDAAFPIPLPDGSTGFARAVVSVDETGARASGGSSAALGSGTNRSGTITAGGTAQQLLAANPARRGFNLQNLSAGDLWVLDTSATGIDATAAAPSSRVAPGGTFTGTTNNRHSIYGATTGQAWSATEVQ